MRFGCGRAESVVGGDGARSHTGRQPTQHMEKFERAAWWRETLQERAIWRGMRVLRLLKRTRARAAGLVYKQGWALRRMSVDSWVRRRVDLVRQLSPKRLAQTALPCFCLPQL